MTGLPVVDDLNYKKEERIVYVTGFNRSIAFVDLENYLAKYGPILNIVQKMDNVS